MSGNAEPYCRRRAATDSSRFYADRNFDHGPFSASIDGGAATMFSSYSAVYTDTNALFSRAVSPGHHVLTITNAAAGTGLGVTYFA